MPLYVFHCSDGHERHLGSWGMHLDDPDAALEVAVNEGRRLARRLPNHAAVRCHRFEIEDDAGRPLMAVPVERALS